METECFLRSIKQWYERATNLDRHWKESRREKERLRGKKKIEAQAPRLNAPVNAGKVQE